MVLDAAYLKATVSGPLSEGIAQAVTLFPADPVEFLGQFLVRHADATNQKKAEAIEEEKRIRQEELRRETEAIKALKEEKIKAAKIAQIQLELEHFDESVASAEATETVFSVAVSFLRQQLGANVYIAVADRPEAPPPTIPEPTVEHEEASPAQEEGEVEKEQPVTGDGEEVEDAAPVAEDPKHQPSVLEYVAASHADEAIMVGQKLSRPKAQASGEADDEAEEEAEAKVAPGSGVTFEAVDAAMRGHAKYKLWRNALLNDAVKFFYMPRKGDYLCVPFLTSSGEALGIIGLDNLGNASSFGTDGINMALDVAAKMAARLEALERAKAERELAELVAMHAQFQKTEVRGRWGAAAGGWGGGCKAHPRLHHLMSIVPSCRRPTLHLSWRRRVTTSSR